MFKTKCLKRERSQIQRGVHESSRSRDPIPFSPCSQPRSRQRSKSEDGNGGGGAERLASSALFARGTKSKLVLDLIVRAIMYQPVYAYTANWTRASGLAGTFQLLEGITLGESVHHLLYLFSARNHHTWTRTATLAGIYVRDDAPLQTLNSSLQSIFLFVSLSLSLYLPPSFSMLSHGDDPMRLYARGRHHQSASSERWENSLQLWLQGRLGFALAWHRSLTESVYLYARPVHSSASPRLASPRCADQEPACVGRHRDLSNTNESALSLTANSPVVPFSPPTHFTSPLELGGCFSRSFTLAGRFARKVNFRNFVQVESHRSKLRRE